MLFSTYLSTKSKEFADKVGPGKAPHWPVGVGGPGAGVFSLVRHEQGAIGYLSQGIATENGVPCALIQNRAGHFVRATAETVVAAQTDAAKDMQPGDAIDSIDGTGENDYPICAVSYWVTRKDLDSMGNRDKAQAFVDFLTWSVNDGQNHLIEGAYDPLSPSLRKSAEQTIASLRWRDQPLKPSRVEPRPPAS